MSTILDRERTHNGITRGAPGVGADPYRISIPSEEVYIGYKLEVPGGNKNPTAYISLEPPLGATGGPHPFVVSWRFNGDRPGRRTFVKYRIQVFSGLGVQVIP